MKTYPIGYLPTIRGFEWGSASFSRIMERVDNGSVCLRVTTKKTGGRGFHIHILRGGKVRIFGPDGREWGPIDKETGKK